MFETTSFNMPISIVSWWIFLFLVQLNGASISTPQVAISIAACQNLYAGVYNPVKIVAQQKEAIKRAQVSAELEVYDSTKLFQTEIKGEDGQFIIVPKEVGLLTLKVETKRGVFTQKFNVRPIQPVAVLGTIKEQGSMKAAIFKAYQGIVPMIQCCGFDARCEILEFSLIKIGGNGSSEKLVNEGGKFNYNTLALINSARAGDIYWFRKIICRCPGNDLPIEASTLSVEIE